MTMAPHSSRTSPRSLALFMLACAAVIGVGVAMAFMIRPMVRAADVTGSISGGTCTNQLPSNFNPRMLNHCVAACISCSRGNQVTCSTSCRLRGAT